MTRLIPRVLKTHGRSWTPQRVARLRTLAEAGLTRPQAARFLKIHYEALRSAAEVHSIQFINCKPGRSQPVRRPGVPLIIIIRAGSLSDLLHKLGAS